MKKTMLVFIVAVLVIAAAAIWIISARTAFKPADIGMYAVMVLVVGFALFIGVKRLISTRKGEPAEDELSKKVLQKAAALSYYISLYLWLAVIYVSEKMDYETHVFLTAGIIGMAVIYALSWLVYNFRGVRNE